MYCTSSVLVEAAHGLFVRRPLTFFVRGELRGGGVVACIRDLVRWITVVAMESGDGVSRLSLNHEVGLLPVGRGEQSWKIERMSGFGESRFLLAELRISCSTLTELGGLPSLVDTRFSGSTGLFSLMGQRGDPDFPRNCAARGLILRAGNVGPRNPADRSWSRLLCGVVTAPSLVFCNPIEGRELCDELCDAEVRPSGNDGQSSMPRGMQLWNLTPFL